MATLAGGPLNTDEYQRSMPKGTPLPPGVYSGMVVKTGQRDTSDRTGVFVEVEFDINSPAEFSNRKFWDRFNILNKSAEAARIGNGCLADLAKAAGFPILNDDQQLVGKEVVMELAVEPAKPYTKNGVEYPGSPQNKCRKYWPVGTDIEAARKAYKEQSKSASGSAAGAPKVWGAQASTAPVAAQVAAAPVQQAAPPATNVAAPWKKNKQ